MLERFAPGLRPLFPSLTVWFDQIYQAHLDHLVVLWTGGLIFLIIIRILPFFQGSGLRKAIELCWKWGAPFIVLVIVVCNLGLFPFYDLKNEIFAITSGVLERELRQDAPGLADIRKFYLFIKKKQANAFF